MDKLQIIEALKIGTIEWRRHALERMLERNISRSEVKKTLLNGEIIEQYETDVPFVSALFLHIDEKPIHVVASLDEMTKIIYVITAYIPSQIHFYDDLKTRR